MILSFMSECGIRIRNEQYMNEIDRTGHPLWNPEILRSKEKK